VVQGNVGVPSAQTREQRGHEASESYDGIAPERAKEQIEPNHVRLEPIDRPQQAEQTARVIERPAAEDRKSLGLNMLGC
jgi:hypothetical protein